VVDYLKLHRISQRRTAFPPIAGPGVRADFEGGTLSLHFGPMILCSVDRRIGLIEGLMVDDPQFARSSVVVAFR
jgi:hypothetical protein